MAGSNAPVPALMGSGIRCRDVRGRALLLVLLPSFLAGCAVHGMPVPAAQTAGFDCDAAPGKSADWYLQRAGGATQIANRKEIFIIRANGSVVGRRSGDWYRHEVLSTRLEPGDVIVVPQKIIGASQVWRNLLSTAQIAASIAITAAVAGI